MPYMVDHAHTKPWIFFSLEQRTAAFLHHSLHPSLHPRLRITRFGSLPALPLAAADRWCRPLFAPLFALGPLAPEQLELRPDPKSIDLRGLVGPIERPAHLAPPNGHQKSQFSWLRCLRIIPGIAIFGATTTVVKSESAGSASAHQPLPLAGLAVNGPDEPIQTILDCPDRWRFRHAVVAGRRPCRHHDS